MKNMKIIILSLSVVSILIIGLFLILDLVNITEYIELSKTYDWLGFMGGFLGSIIGGIMTYIGVYLTLKYQRNADNQMNRLSIIPILEYKVSYEQSDFDNSEGQLAGEVIPIIKLEEDSLSKNNILEWYFNLIIKNVGVGHAQITKININVKDNSHDFIEEHNMEYNYKLVKKGCSNNFLFIFEAPKERFESKHKSGSEFLYVLDICIEYQDLLKNKYQQLVHTSISKSNWIDEGTFVWGPSTADLQYYENFELLK